MAETEQWPPRSPLKTLLSSPSGKKRYRDFQTANPTSISPNKLLGSPSLLEKLRAARADRDEEFLEPQKRADDEEEEDEETLQLKLQAIEAKLKLKRLQQQKAKGAETIRPQSSTSSAVYSAQIEVPLSPTKRVVPSMPKSPSRVVLGIDKGVSAADVSLKRPRTVNEHTTRERDQRTQSRVPKSLSIQGARLIDVTAAPVMSFSERMANMRNKEKNHEEKRSATQNARSAGFKIDKNELESYHNAAGIASAVATKRTTKRAASPSGQATSSTTATQSRTIKHSQSMPSMRSSSPSKSTQAARLTPDLSNPSEEPKGDPTLYEPFSNTHVCALTIPDLKTGLRSYLGA